MQVFFAPMRLTDSFFSISHSFQTQMRQKPFFSYILSTYQHILILSCRQFLRFSLFSACAISDKEVPMKKEKHSDISSRKKSNQKIIDSYDYLSNAASAAGLHRSDPCRSHKQSWAGILRRSLSLSAAENWSGEMWVTSINQIRNGFALFVRNRSLYLRW